MLGDVHVRREIRGHGLVLSGVFGSEMRDLAGEQVGGSDKYGYEPKQEQRGSEGASAKRECERVSSSTVSPACCYCASYLSTCTCGGLGESSRR